MTRSSAEISEAAYWAIRVALRRELREVPIKPLLGAPRDVPFTWQPAFQAPRLAVQPAPLLAQAAE